MGIRSFISSCWRIIRIITRPEGKELWASIKMSLVAIGLIGGIAFVIKFISSMFQTQLPTT